MEEGCRGDVCGGGGGGGGGSWPSMAVECDGGCVLATKC